MYDVGALVARLNLATDGWKQGVDRVLKDKGSLSKSLDELGRKLQDVGKGMTITGAAMTAPLVAMLKGSANAGDEIAKLAQKVGISTGLLSAYKLQAGLAGTSLEGLAVGLRGLASRMLDSNYGLEEAKRAFDALGISVADNMGKLRPLEDVMLDVADRFKAMEDGATKTALAQDLFGRSGMDLIPMLNEGRDALVKGREEAERLGVVWSEKAAKSAEAFNDSLETLGAGLKGAGQQMTVQLMPTLTELAGRVTDVVARFTAWIQEHPALTKALGLLVVGLGGLLTVGGSTVFMLGTLARSLSSIATGLPNLRAGLGALISPLGAVAAGAAAVGLGLNYLIDRYKAKQDAEIEAIVKQSGPVAAAFQLRRELIKEQIMTHEEWRELFERHGRDYARVMQAIAHHPDYATLRERWEELKRKQEEARDPMRRIREEADRLAASFRNAVPPIKSTAEILATAVPPARNLEAALRDLAREAELLPTKLPQPRDLSRVFEDLAPKAKEATEQTAGYFDGLYNDIASGWGNTIQTWLEGATTFRDFMKGLWGDLKSSFFRVVGEMAAKWAVGFAQSIIPKAAEAGEAIGSKLLPVLKSAGSAITGLAEGVASILPAIARGIAAAATTLAGALPEILAVGAAAIALYAGFMAVNKLLGSGGGKSQDITYWLKPISERAQEIRDWLFINLEERTAVWTDWFASTFPILEQTGQGALDRLDTANSYLDRIASATEGMRSSLSKVVPAASGYEGIVTRPTLFLAGEGGIRERVSIQPQGQASAATVHHHHNLTVQIQTYDGAELDTMFRRKLVPMLQRHFNARTIMVPVGAIGGQ